MFVFFDCRQEMKSTENVPLVIALNPSASNNKQIIEFLRCLTLSSNLGRKICCHGGDFKV